MSDLIFGAFEDVTQLIIMTVNTMRLGQSLTYVQVLSPIATALAMSMKGKGAAKLGGIYLSTCVVLGLFIYIVRHFVGYTPCPYEVCADMTVYDVGA